MTVVIDRPKSMEGWADFWRYMIGVNVIPVDTRNKRPIVKWQEYQDAPVPEKQHQEWKSDGMFAKGMAIVLGKVWHRADKIGFYLAGIDADNRKAIEELCTRNGRVITMQDFAQWTVVEQHKDNLSRAHLYLYTTRPFAKKGSDNVSADMAARIKADDIPAIEVKGLGVHGLMICSGSINKDGYGYEIIGTMEPAIADDFEQHIDEICKKYGMAYLGTKDGNGKTLLPMRELFRPDHTVLEGHNRHEALLRVMESLLFRNGEILSLEEIRGLAEKWNAEHCRPPLSPEEVSRQWKDATNFVEQKTIASGDGDNNAGEQCKGDVEKAPAKSRAQVAFDLAETQCSEYFVDEHENPFAVINVDDHREVLPMSGQRFKHWLAMIYHQEKGDLLTDSDLANMLGVVKAKAVFKGRQQKMELRVATEFEDGADRPTAIYYDLVNRRWDCIKVTAEGWVKQPCPTFFRRYNSNRAQVEPAREYPKDIFDQFLALTNVVRSDWLLVKSYVLALFMPEMPKPVQMPHGEKGGRQDDLPAPDKGTRRPL